MRLHGLGDTAACGDNPCGAWDWVWTRDACLNYLGCADPSDIRYRGAYWGDAAHGQGLIAATATDVGEETGSTASNLIAGLTHSVSGPGMALIGLGAAVGLLLLLKK